MDLTITGNQNTVYDGFLFLQNHPSEPEFYIMIINGYYSENTTIYGAGGLYVINLFSSSDGA